jgi:uncharacterized protein (DUF58 family)
MMPFSEIATALLPPHDKDPKVTAYRWMNWIGMMVLFILVAWLVYNTALASELSDLTKKVESIEKSTLDGKIFDKSVQVCQATGPLRTAHAAELARLVDEWRRTTNNPNGTPATFKTCQELGLR